MPAFTNFLGLYKPGGGSTGLILPDEVVDIDRINSNMDTIDLFAKGWGQAAERNHQLYGPAAALAGVTGMKLNDTYQESDGSKVLWKFDGTNWVTNEGGMYLIRPSSVTGGLSIDTNGNVVGTAVASGPLDILGIFSSRFTDYRVELRVVKTAAGGSGSLVGLVGTTPVATATHFNQSMVIVSGAAPAIAYSAGETSFSNLWDVGSTNLGVDATIFSPNKAELSLITTHIAGRGSQANMGFKTGGLETTDQLTGLRLNYGQVLPVFRMKVYGLA